MWRDISGYNGTYQVNESGEVRNALSGRMLKQQRNRFGYMTVKLFRHNHGKEYKVHRLVAIAFIENRNHNWKKMIRKVITLRQSGKQSKHGTGGQRMIPKTAFIALALIMVSAWAFGIFCDRMITKWHKSLTEPSEDPDIVRYTCDNCKHKDLSWYDEPCDSCTGDKWEAETK